MTFQSIGLGSSANDGTGDTIRAGGDKINDNFTEIYTLLGTGTALTSGLSATSSVVTLAIINYLLIFKIFWFASFFIRLFAIAVTCLTVFPLTTII